MSKAYRDAGVDIDAGDEAVSRISSHIARTHRKEVLGGFGGFGALFAIPEGYNQPVLVSGTDGVGTKLLVAQRLNRHQSIGIDLVAMCVNDIATMGAQPLFFLDYFATGKLSPEVVEEVVAGIADGCVQAGCALIGGETAEMPGMYGAGHYDLAGFCVGVVEKERIIDGKRIAPDDVLIGIPSSGLHSNGYSLARKICDPLDWADTYELGQPLGEVLLSPTKIYVQQVLSLIERFQAKGFAHITGGGLVGNIPRILPKGMGVLLDRTSWPELPIFSFLQKRGDLTDDDMVRTFNCGVGLVAVVSPEHAQSAATHLNGYVIGKVTNAEGVSWR